MGHLAAYLEQNLPCVQPSFSCHTIAPVPAKEPKREFRVGDHISRQILSRSNRRSHDSRIPGVEGKGLQVDWGYDQTALIEERQIVKE
jgi:hypothetical protein